MSSIISKNPANNYEINGKVKVSTPKQIKRKVKLAKSQRDFWQNIGIEKRIELIEQVCLECENKKEKIAKLITKEIGSPIRENLSMMNFDLGYFKHFLQNGKKYLENEVTHEDEKSEHKIIYEPRGTAAVILPWNFPFEMFVWGVIPNLVAGNTVVMKHSELCPLTAKYLEDEIVADKLPKGVLNFLYGDGKTGQQLLDQDVDLIWFTGSCKVGKEIYNKASSKFIKAILEMGGSDPCVVFEDVDVKKIVSKIYFKRFLNNGQVCGAVKRLIVHENVFDKVVRQLKELIQKKTVGDPMDENTDLGSLSSKKQLEKLQKQFQDAKQKGAKVITGGLLAKNLKGAYFLPTLLTKVNQKMKVWKEEVFGPILPIVSFKTEKEAIKMANASRYGLGAVIFSSDTRKAEKVAGKIDVGTVEINSASHWLACNPFGGNKLSGIGREHGETGFKELCKTKVISKQKSK